MQIFPVTIAALFVVMPAGTQAADTRFGLDTELAQDTNINRAYGGEERSDTILAAEGYAARSVKLSYRSGIAVRGGLRLREHGDFGKLSNAAALGRVAYRFQPQPSYTGAWVELTGTAEALRYRDSILRDGTIFSGAVSIGKHFTDRIRFGAGLGLDQREGRSGALYDLSTTRAWLTLDYRVTPKITVYGSSTLIQGDHVVNANYPGNQNKISGYYDVIEIEPAFAGAFGGTPGFAYRVKATTLILDAGINIPIKGGQALDFGASWYDSESDTSRSKYSGAIVRANYFYRFR